VSTLEIASKRTVKPFAVRRHVNSKILRFSLSIGVAAALLTASAYIASAYPSIRRWKEINFRALSEIKCEGSTCDTSKFTTDSQSSEPDYLVDTETRYLMSVATPAQQKPGRFAPLDYSDTAFIARFREPSSYNTLDGEVWRLYSRQASVGGKTFEIIVGYAEKAPWKMIESVDSQTGIVDAKLKREAEKIVASLPSQRASVGGRNGLIADGFAVVEAETKQVAEWGPWLPEFLPADIKWPTPGYQIYVYENDLYLSQTATNGRVLATSFVPVADLWGLATLCAVAFLGTSIVAGAFSRRYLRTYFAMSGVRVPTLEEALRAGEGQTVEFKRGLSETEAKTGNVEDELLKSIAAFANTNDGVIFIGIDDAGHVRGLDLDFMQKDRFQGKIRQLVRNRIKPRPPIQITFEEVRNLVIAKIIVVRGEAPAYMMGGVIYIRDGSSDVQAQPDDLRRLVYEYAF
jgi:hypothetical protein